MVEFRIPRRLKKKIILNIRRHNYPKENTTKYYKYFVLIDKAITVKTCNRSDLIQALDWLKFNYPHNAFYKKSLKNIN